MTEPVSAVQTLGVGLEYGYTTVRRKLLLRGHFMPEVAVDRIEDLQEDLETYPDTQVIFVDPGAPSATNHANVAAVSAIIPDDMPIILITWDVDFWRNFCSQSGKTHQVVSYEVTDFSEALAIALT